MNDGRSPILVAGAINTDLVATMVRAPEAGETITGRSFSIHGGGKAALVGAIGSDGFGRARLVELGHDRVDTEWVLTSERETSGVALILVEDGGENRIAYIPGATRTVTADHARSALEVVQPAFVLATHELPHQTLAALFQAASNAGVPVVLNATPDPEAARELLRWVSVLVVNEGEAAALLDASGSMDPRQAVSQLRTLGPGTVVVTAGPDGACAGDSEGVVWHRPPRVEAIDTTAAGDTFCGAFATELAHGRALDEALRFGVHASALSVARAGAQSSIPRRAEVEGSLGQG